MEDYVWNLKILARKEESKKLLSNLYLKSYSWVSAGFVVKVSLETIIFWLKVLTEFEYIYIRTEYTINKDFYLECAQYIGTRVFNTKERDKYPTGE